MSVSAWYDIDSEAPLYYITPSLESENAPSSFGSETESTSLGTTIHSDELHEYFVLHHGRQQPASDNIVKWFPPDNIRRDILRWVVIRSIFGEDYTGPIKEVLGVVDGRERRVLDLGTRSGTWIQLIAAEFPHVQFLSLDVAPITAHVPRPNFVFEVYDFTEGLMVEDESQDVIFLNALVEMVKDYRFLLREAYRVLRPGGLIHIIDFNPHFWGPEVTSAPIRKTNPQGCHAYEIIRQHISKLGIDPDTCDKLPNWLAPESDLWDKDQRGFARIKSVIRMRPAYPHDGFPCMNYYDTKVVSYVRHLFVQSWRDIVGILRDAGMGEEESNRLVEGVLEELRQPGKCGFNKLYYISAVKI